MRRLEVDIQAMSISMAKASEEKIHDLPGENRQLRCFPGMVEADDPAQPNDHTVVTESSKFVRLPYQRLQLQPVSRKHEPVGASLKAVASLH